MDDKQETIEARISSITTALQLPHMSNVERMMLELERKDLHADLAARLAAKKPGEKDG